MAVRLYRSESNKTVAGVLGGLGEYFDIDPVLVRIFYVAVTIFTGVVPGAVVYLLAIFIVPRAPQNVHSSSAGEESAAGDKKHGKGDDHSASR